jgi:hypothetical protein
VATDTTDDDYFPCSPLQANAAGIEKLAHSPFTRRYQGMNSGFENVWSSWKEETEEDLRRRATTI